MMEKLKIFYEEVKPIFLFLTLTAFFVAENYFFILFQKNVVFALFI